MLGQNGLNTCVRFGYSKLYRCAGVICAALPALASAQAQERPTNLPPVEIEAPQKRLAAKQAKAVLHLPIDVGATAPRLGEGSVSEPGRKQQRGEAENEKWPHEGVIQPIR